VTAKLLRLLEDPSRLAEVPPDAIPPLLAQLAALQSALAARLLAAPPQDGQPGTAAEAARLLTIPEVADLLTLPRGRVYELGRQGRLPIVRIGKYVRVRLADLREWVARHHEKELDRPSSVTLPSRRDRSRGTENPQASGAHAGSIRRARRCPPRNRGPVGAGNSGDPGVGRPAHPAAGEDGVKAKA